jgi:hypothetical protein
MAEHTIQLGERLNETTALQFAADLNLLEPAGEIVLDFSSVAHFEPFGMLLASSAVNRLRRRASAVGVPLTIPTRGIENEGIAGHMGFWQSMGVPIGRPVNAPRQKETYLPMTRIGVDEIYRESGGADPLGSGIIERRAAELSGILSPPKSDALREALTYSIRELMRNVIEHAMTPALWIAGMSWPRRNYVQVAVLDEGRGIRASLATNSQYRFENDISAIRAALQPGVSRNAGREMPREKLERLAEERHDLPPTLLQNAGYGLYMISTLCREAGQFLIASGSSSLAYVGSGEIEGATGHHGTAIRLVLQPTDVPQAWDRLFAGETARGPAGRRPMLSASTLRKLGLDKLPRNNRH